METGTTRSRLGAFIGALLASALMCALWAGIASAAASNGTLEICKAGDNGAAGQKFNISYAKGTATPTSVTVTGGTCNAAISVPVGTYTLQEDLSSGLWVMSGSSVVPAGNWVSENDRVGKLKVSVVANAETQATLVNSPAGATIKVCKWSASPALQGAQYSFTVNGQTVTAVAGKNAANPGCSTALGTLPGTKLKIQESVPSGETVASTTFNGASVANTAGLVSVKAATGANIVTFENEPVGPPQTGYVEICKDSGDDFVANMTDPFVFTVTDKTNVAVTVNVLVNQCSGPIKVAAGNVAIAETQGTQTYVSSIFAAPDPNALGPTNLTNGTTTAVVPVAADSSGEVQVHFVNTTITSTVKVCKYLTTGSDALAGQTFNYSYTDGGQTGTLSIVAVAGSAGACKIIGGSQWPTAFPVGSTITVTEDLSSYPYVSGDGNPRGTADVQTTSIVGGINTVPFHNQALGQIEICKAMLGDNKNGIDDTNFNNIAVFHFSIDGKGDYAVAAGHCSMPVIVNAGSHTVQENVAKSMFGSEHPTGQTVSFGFAFVSSTATGPTGDNRATSGNANNGGNPITVNVPYFCDPVNGGETLVTFTNRVLRAQIKVCKVVESGSLTPLRGRRELRGHGLVEDHARASRSRLERPVHRPADRTATSRPAGRSSTTTATSRPQRWSRRSPGRTSSRPRRLTTPCPARVEPRSVALRPTRSRGTRVSAST